MTADWADIFPSEPISGETAATVELVGEDWQADEDWRRFREACRTAAWGSGSLGLGSKAGWVDPNRVREFLADDNGDLTIEPRRYSAFWHRASRGKDAFLVADGWVVNTDAHGRNQGKPLRRYRLRSGP